MAAGGARRRGAARPALAALLFAALALLLAAGCGPRYRRTVVHDQGGIIVTLRSQLVDGGVAPRGHAHPATISGVRLAHILSRIDVRLSASADDEAGTRRPGVPTELIYPLGDALSRAFAKADPTQEVVAIAIRREKRMAIFTQERVTSLRAWVEGDRLVIHLAQSDDLVGKAELDDLREPLPGREVQDFKVVATEGLTPLADQVIAARWRDPRFRRAGTLAVGPGGRVMRRTILMEAPPEPEEPEAAPLQLPSDPEALRELAELEELRRAGEISEREYHRRRDALLRDEPAAGTSSPRGP